MKSGNFYWDVGETLMTASSPAQLRYNEAYHFFQQFIIFSGPPRDSYFRMVCYFDAFLFALVSIEEMVDDTAKDHLRDVEVFRFVKALRNITMHHAVLGASLTGARFDRPFSRHISECVGGDPEISAKLAIRYDAFRSIFDAIEAERPGEKRTLNAARKYLSELEGRAQPVFLEPVLLDALRAVASIVA